MSGLKEVITSPHVAKPVAKYSQAIRADGTLYISGMIGTTLEGKFAGDTVEAQAEQVSS